MDEEKKNEGPEKELPEGASADADESLIEVEDDELEGGKSPTAGDSIAKELLPVSIEAEMRQSYLDYAMSVIVGRALPDVRDGLKPVHRRVLYAMKEIGNTHNNPTKKAARIVGEVIGKYHPHGDAAAYQTIVRMAQDFSLRYPLVYGQGNFGSIDGDGAAAMRYTEVRLEKIAASLLADINEETVDFVPNFDNSEREPVVLPTRLPQLLINGSTGIAVGMATNIPPHNLRETIDACLHALDNPLCTIDELIDLMPAPDFPTGGIIFGVSGVRQAYRTGRGRVIMRARTHYETFGRDHSRTRIVVDEIPYMVNKRTMYERIHELWREKKLDGISEMRDESAKTIRIAIDLQKGVMPEVVLNNLFKLTQMQESMGINMVALVDGQPMLLNLKQMIDCFLSHRREVVTRRTIYRLRKSREAGHLLEGQAVALENLDEFILLIRAARTVEEAHQSLYARGWNPGFASELTARAGEHAAKRYPENMEAGRGLRADGLYYLTHVQVDNILAMNLRRLTGLEREKVMADFTSTFERIIDLIDILVKPHRVTQIIGQELREIRDEFGDERRSTIDLNGDPNFDKRDLIPRRDMLVTLTRDGFVKSQDLADYQAQSRGGKGRNVQATTRDDVIDTLFIANSHDIVLCFSSLGRAYWLDVFDLPEGKSNTRGRPIVNLLQLQENEHISFMLPVQGFEEDRYVVLATNNGLIKRSPLTAFRNARAKGVQGTLLGEGERLIGVGLSNGSCDLMLFTSAGRAVRFHETELRVKGRVSHGNRGVLLPEGVEAVSLVVVDCEEGKCVVTATEFGYGKRTPVSSFPIKHRGTRGQIAQRVTEKLGRLASAAITTDDDDIMLLSTGGKVVRARVSEVRLSGRGTAGVCLIRVGDDTLQTLRVAPAGEADEVVHLEASQEEEVLSEEELKALENEDDGDDELIDDYADSEGDGFEEESEA